MTRSARKQVSTNPTHDTDGIVTNEVLMSMGVPKSTIAHRCRPRGPWQRMFPGVVMLGSGTPTRRQRLRAAIALAGKEAIITGVDALHAHGLDLATPPLIRLLVPQGRRMASPGFLSAERSSRLPEPIHRDGLPFEIGRA